jgi:aminomethyltransferase
MKTGLYERHVALGAKIVDFAGWEMPVQYSGVIKEHQAVREKAGLFDVSHMGRILVNGPDAEKLLDFLSTNRISGKNDWTATYTVWCDQAGGCVDDLIVYRQGPEKFFVIVNAGNREKDLQHLKHAAAGFDVHIEERYKDGILALQGPSAHAIMAEIFPEAKAVKPMRFLSVDYSGDEVILSGTGYTGAGGFELYGSTSSIISLWDALMEAGRLHGILPIGLGARDTLRLEMGFPLYGHELSQDIAPTESVVSWTVKFDKEDFLGKEALDVLESQGTKRSEYGIVLKEKGIAREGYSVSKNGEPIGKVTSGTMSPSLQKAIAIILVDGSLEQGETIEIDIRGKQVKAVVVPLPFWRKES